MRYQKQLIEKEYEDKYYRESSLRNQTSLKKKGKRKTLESLEVNISNIEESWAVKGFSI